MCKTHFKFVVSAGAGDIFQKEKSKKSGLKAIHLNAMAAHNIIASIYEAKVIFLYHHLRFFPYFM